MHSDLTTSSQPYFRSRKANREASYSLFDLLLCFHRQISNELHHDSVYVGSIDISAGVLIRTADFPKWKRRSFFDTSADIATCEGT